LPGRSYRHLHLRQLRHARRQSEQHFRRRLADNASSAPSKPRQSQIAAEAVRAAQHFGNTTAASNASVQYVIATATRNNSRGFGSQYCAYHSATSSAVGNVAYTNLPYMTDAGANCGANFNGLGPDAGITIVGGHEMGETITDQFRTAVGWTPLARKTATSAPGFLRARRFGGHLSLHRHVRRAVSLEQRLQHRLRRLRPNISLNISLTRPDPLVPVNEPVRFGPLS